MSNQKTIYEPKHNYEGLKIGPYPNDSYIIVNPDGSLFIEFIKDDTIVWSPLRSKREWLGKENKVYMSKPTDDYTNIKYRKMMDFVIGYLDEKTLRMHTMYGDDEIYIDLALSNGQDVKYINGKYIL